MGFNSREKKRKARAAIEANRRQHPTRWYITPVKRPCSCNRCGGSIRAGSDLVYRRAPREVVCVVCAQLHRLAPRPSLAYERKYVAPKMAESRRTRQREKRKAERNVSHTARMGDKTLSDSQQESKKLDSPTTPPASRATMDPCS